MEQMRLLDVWRSSVVAWAIVGSALGGGSLAEARQEVELASRASGAKGERANANSSDPAISANGRYVAFESGASNLVADDTDGVRDIFVRDRREKTTTLVSRATGAHGAKANAGSSEPAISANGRYVAFASFADNLVPESSDEEQLFVRDLVENTTVLVSRASGPGGAPSDAPNFSGYSPSISADGSRVAFATPATLDPSDSDGTGDIYVRDLIESTTTLVSRSTGSTGSQSADSSYDPSISGDGTRIAFTLVTGAFDGEPVVEPSSIWLRDLPTATTTLVSRESGADGRFHGNNGSPSISANGARVAFKGPRTLEPVAHPGFADIAMRDLDTLETTMVDRDLTPPKGMKPADANHPSIAGDGDQVAFSVRFVKRKPSGPDPRRKIYLAHIDEQEVGPVSGALGDRPSLSANGRWVAFRSRARLDPDDRDEKQDIFVTRVGR